MLDQRIRYFCVVGWINSFSLVLVITSMGGSYWRVNGDTIVEEVASNTNMLLHLAFSICLLPVNQN